jgi:hypothetical protein
MHLSVSTPISRPALDAGNSSMKEALEPSRWNLSTSTPISGHVHIPEDHNLGTHCQKNVISHIMDLYLDEIYSKKFVKVSTANINK